MPFLGTDGVPIIERNPEARRELSEKQARAGVHFGDVLMVDVNGTVMEGFDSSGIDDTLLQ